MHQIQLNIETYKEKKGPKIDHQFQELCLDMIAYFGEKQKGLIWSLPYKHNLEKLREAFRRCKASKVRSVRYLLGIIKNLR